MPGFEDFVLVARAVIEGEAREHAEDRFWVLEPTFIVGRRDGSIEVSLATEAPDALRAIARDGFAAGLEPLAARRYALAVHADLALEGEIAPAIVLGVAGSLATAFQFARVSRTEAGLPRLGGWEPQPAMAEELAAAVGRLVGPG
jgi:hypothetical protein